MDWDIIDKFGNQLPPLEEFFEEVAKRSTQAHRYSTEGEHQRRTLQALKGQDEDHPLISLSRHHAHITRNIPISEAKKRPTYKETMQKEMSRFLEYSAYGKPVPWHSVDKHARIYRGKPIYGIKFFEMPESEHKDKARVIVQGCIQIRKHGGIVLDKLTRRRGEYWCPVGSMTDLRLILNCAAIQELNNETSDLSNGYLQTPTETPNLYIDLATELHEILPQEWQDMIEEA